MKSPTKIAAAILFAWTLGLFVYGLAVFPDSPYKPCDGPGGYCGKGGRPHIASEYQAQQKWQTALFISAPLGILAGIYLFRRRRP